MACLTDTVGNVNLVMDYMDLHISHDRFGSSSNPSPNGHLNYPAPDDIDEPLNEAATDKIQNTRIPSFITVA